jgi:hypothetical protein
VNASRLTHHAFQFNAPNIFRETRKTAPETGRAPRNDSTVQPFNDSTVSGLRFQVSGLKSQVSSLRSQVSGLKSQVSGLRSQVSACQLFSISGFHALAIALVFAAVDELTQPLTGRACASQSRFIC